MPKAVMRKKELKEKKPRFGVIPKMRVKISSNWLVIGLLIVAYGVFYFIFKDTLPFTPDFGSSDAFHSNVSFKYYLWQSIRLLHLPFWSDKLAGGFPLIAETQIGAFFLPHYIIFPLFSVFSHAYMFLFAFHMFLLSAGMFMLLKELKVPSLLSLLLAITFSWCGAVTLRWVHFNFLQVFSLGPWLYLLYFKWNEEKNTIYAFIMSFLICQMIFAGHMQTTFNLLFGLTLLHLFLNYRSLYSSIKYCGIVALGFILAAPQIVPTIQFSHLSFRNLSNTYQYIVQFVFNTKDLIGIYTSKALGTPLDASYGDLVSSGSRIYWENTPYLGELFIIGMFLMSIYYFFNLKRQALVSILFLLSSFFLLLSFGGDSPLFFLFGVFPFNMFRTPSRYLLIFVFFLILYSGLICKHITAKNNVLSTITCVVLIINSCLLLKSAFEYNVFVDSHILLKSVNKLSSISPSSSYIVFGEYEIWNTQFKKTGWKTNKNIKSFVTINSALLPNSNLIAGLSNYEVYTGGLKMRRSEYIFSLIYQSLLSFSKNKQDYIKIENIESFLQLYNIESIVSFKSLNIPHFDIVQTVKDGNIAFSVYKNIKAKSNIFYIPLTIKSLSYLEDVDYKLIQTQVSESNSFAESIGDTFTQESGDTSIAIRNQDDHYVNSIIGVSGRKFIAIKKNWYPEWKLYIDGKQSSIYKTNLVHMGFYVPKGQHRIELRYVPTSFYQGCIIALLGIGGVAVYAVKKRLD